MRTIHHHAAVPAAISLLAAAVLVACGEGGDAASGPPPPAATRLKGVAAVGAPMAGATITVIDADPATADPPAVSAAADGSYGIDVSTLRPPLLVRASAIVDGAPALSLALVPSLNAGTDNTANVTPLTHAVAALMAPGGDPAALATPATLAAHASAAQVAQASALLVNTLASDSQIAAALGSGFDPLSTPFAADGHGIDGVLDRLGVEVTAAGVAITNRTSALDAGALPVPVVLTPAQTATPTAAPTLPPSAPAADIPGPADLAAIAARLQACLALPVAQRVTVDGDGRVTSVLAPCNYAPADWKSNGRTWAEEVGQFTFARNHLGGARVGKGMVVLALAPENLTDAREHKHPYCNSGPCVVVRFPVTTAGGQATSSDWVMGKTATGWDIVGNQRPYRVFVEPRLNRKINVNRDGAAPGNTADPYFFNDRYESVLRLIFDLNSPGSADVRAVRITGPGLPAAGIVLARSQRCGTDDRMGIVYQNGSTRLPGGSQPLLQWTGGAAADFVLDAAHLDGSALALPVPVLNATTVLNQDFSPAPVADQARTIPAWSRYRVEVFRYSSASDLPDEVLHIRIGAGAENAAAGVTKPWPTLDAGFIETHLKPGGTGAGAIDTVAGSLAWTAVAGTYVGSGYLFGQNFASATNAENETATYGRRSRLDFEPVALGDRVAPASAFASTVAGTSLSTYTASLGSNPNPRCGGTGLVPLTANTSDYREAGLGVRGSDRKLFNAIWFWDN